MKHKLIVKRGERCKICTCGKSKIMPICDDAHRKLNEEKNTNYKSL
jgi:CDGSH-type Zn-finger protein